MRKSKAFTLAEVIITLTIIGVVAALTIPDLINSINENHYKVAAKKAYADMSGIIKQMVRDKGSMSFYIGNNGSFKPDFKKYFNIIKDCGYDECAPQTASSDIYKTLLGYSAPTWHMDEGQFITNNGIFISIENSGNASNGLMVTVDVNGHLKQPNRFGKDTFIFQIVNDTLLPMGAAGTSYPASTYCNKSINESHQGFGCAVNIMTNTDY